VKAPIVPLMGVAAVLTDQLPLASTGVLKVAPLMTSVRVLLG
jgi:hypothetical protein